MDMMMLRNLKMTVAYDGTNYHGFQKQQGTGLKTIQESLEEAIFVLTREYVTVCGSGRTDAGVHAEGQVINFHSTCRIPAERFPLAINSVLPHDIRVYFCEEVEPDFHARFSAKQKTYCYKLFNARHLSPFWRHYAYHIPILIDLNKMQQAAGHFLGAHDFRGFCAKGAMTKSYVRNITECGFRSEGDLILFQVTGDGFLWNMVRIMMGTLLEVGEGKRAPEDIPCLLTAGERRLSGETIPPQGLYLMSVEY